MKYLLFASTFLFIVAFSEVDALTCYKCVYNATYDPPQRNSACSDPFDYDAIDETETCPANQVCAKYPAYLGDRSGEFLVSLERKCGPNTGNGCITFSDDKGGYLKICGAFCDHEDKCNGTVGLYMNMAALLTAMLFAMVLTLL